MNKKTSIIIAILFLTACKFPFFKDKTLPVEKTKNISLERVGNPEKDGNLIALQIVSQNRLSDKQGKAMCAHQTMFGFTYVTPKKRPKKDVMVAKDDFSFMEKFPNGKWKAQRGRYQIYKEDIYLIHNGEKILPNEIFWRKQFYDMIESNSVAFANHNKLSTKIVTFPLPCTALVPSKAGQIGSKLVISRIYQDGKVIKQDIEFSFSMDEENKTHKIWLK